MESLRFAGLVVTAFLLTFAAGYWLPRPHPPQLEARLPASPRADVASPDRLTTPRPPKPDGRLLPTWHRVDVNSAEYKMAQSSASDNDAGRDKLRHAVLEAARDLLNEPCNDAMKAHYIEAATKYTRAWLSIVPCFATKTCFGSSDVARLDRARDTFGTPLDHRVRDAMVKAHATGAIREGDFPKDTAMLMAQFAHDPVINPLADAQIKQSELESRGERVCRS